MKRKDWTGGLFFIYLAFVIWVILLKFSTSPDALPHLRNINLIPYGDCLMVNGNLDIRELAENILIFVPFGIYGGMLARERAGGTVILAGAGFSLFLETLQYLLAMGAVIGVLLWKAFRKIAGEKSWLIVQILATVGTVGMLGVSVLICIANA